MHVHSACDLCRLDAWTPPLAFPSPPHTASRTTLVKFGQLRAGSIIWPDSGTRSEFLPVVTPLQMLRNEFSREPPQRSSGWGQLRGSAQTISVGFCTIFTEAHDFRHRLSNDDACDTLLQDRCRMVGRSTAESRQSSWSRWHPPATPSTDFAILENKVERCCMSPRRHCD